MDCSISPDMIVTERKRAFRMFNFIWFRPILRAHHIYRSFGTIHECKYVQRQCCVVGVRFVLNVNPDVRCSHLQLAPVEMLTEVEWAGYIVDLVRNKGLAPSWRDCVMSDLMKVRRCKIFLSLQVDEEEMQRCAQRLRVFLGSNQ